RGARASSSATVGLERVERERPPLDGKTPADAGARRETFGPGGELLGPGPGRQLGARLVARDQVRVEVAAAELEADVRRHDVAGEQRHVVDAVADQVDEGGRFALVALGDGGELARR